MQRDYWRAEGLIRQVSLEKFPLYHFVAAIIYAQLGMKPEAAEARDKFLRMRPRFFDNWDQEAAKRNYWPEDAAHLAQGARQAGFPVPTRMAAEAALQAVSLSAERAQPPRTYRMLQAIPPPGLC